MQWETVFYECGLYLGKIIETFPDSAKTFNVGSFSETFEVKSFRLCFTIRIRIFIVQVHLTREFVFISSSELYTISYNLWWPSWISIAALGRFFFSQHVLVTLCSNHDCVQKRVPERERRRERESLKFTLLITELWGVYGKSKT